MRNKEFIPYEQALALQQLGFNEECFGTWFELEGKYSVIIRNNLYGNDLQTPSPLYQQAFRFFNEKYVLNHYNIRRDYYISEDGVRSYDDIELECLKKLIEIVKEKK